MPSITKRRIRVSIHTHDTPEEEYSAFRERLRDTNAHKRSLHADGNHHCEACGWTPAPEFLELFRNRNCQKIVPCLELHHVVPAACGGDNSPDNLLQLCPNCHSYADIISTRCFSAGVKYKPNQVVHASFNVQSKAELLASLKLLHTDPERWARELPEKRKQTARDALESLDTLRETRAIEAAAPPKPKPPKEPKPPKPKRIQRWKHPELYLGRISEEDWLEQRALDL